jgi:hypothetical protein
MKPLQTAEVFFCSEFISEFYPISLEDAEINSA